MNKEICYLRLQAGADGVKTAENEEKKKYLTGQGCLAVTIIEGNEDMEKGLREIVRNHV